ncbi:MAG TPA: tRNA pseudouridine(38-40) synthase TruA [Longimicrobiales bacterium]
MSPTNERRIKLTLHYDGGGFFGWQVQPGARTVQGELEAALSRLTNRPTRVVGAGRTDRGVHATGQVASALVPGRWTAASLRKSLNAILPADIWVAASEEVPVGFHARFDATSRSYVYRVGTSEAARSPFRRRWCWPLTQPLDRDALDAAARAIVGDHSFRAFAKAGQEERGDRCDVVRAEWRDRGDAGVEFHVTANRFLHHMVRYLVGTMVDVARGRRPVEDVARLLAGEPGLETSPPAPPEGLFLTHVAYNENERTLEETEDEDLP